MFQFSFDNAHLAANNASRLSLVFVVVVILALSVSSAHAQGATRLWYFGNRAGIEFTSAGPVPATWVDTSYIAPGILHRGNGEAIYFMLEKGCIDPQGKSVLFEGKSDDKKMKNAEK